MSNEPIARYTAETLARMRKRGKTRTDWQLLDTMTEDELETAIAADPDSEVPPGAWDNATGDLPDVIKPEKHGV